MSQQLYASLLPMSADLAIAASSSSSTTPIPQPNKRVRLGRLPKECSKVLEDCLNADDFWEKYPSGTPDIVKKRELLREIQKIPGFESYSVQNITSWFMYRRDKTSNEIKTTAGRRGRPHKVIQTPVDDRFPSLNASITEDLRVLSRGQNPTPELIKTWARLLASQGAKHDDVERWVYAQQQHERAEKIARLPTPATTVTPEPSMSPSALYANPYGVYKQDPQSPTLPPLSVDTQQHHMKLSPKSERRASYDWYSSSPTRYTPVSPSSASEGAVKSENQPDKKVMKTRALQAIRNGVVDAIKTPITPTAKYPTNADELNVMFAPYECTLAQLKDILDAS